MIITVFKDHVIEYLLEWRVCYFDCLLIMYLHRLIIVIISYCKVNVIMFHFNFLIITSRDCAYFYTIMFGY